MPPPIIYIPSDSEDEAGPPPARISVNGKLTVVNLLGADEDSDGMDWEASSHINDAVPKANIPTQLTLSSNQQATLSQKQQTVISLIDSDDDDTDNDGPDDGGAQTFVTRPSEAGPTESCPTVTIGARADLQHDDAAQSHPLCSTALIAIDMPKSTLVNPRSSFMGFEPTATEITEHQLLQAIQRTRDRARSFEIDLCNFSVYVDSRLHGTEFRSLQALGTTIGNSTLYFDGEVCVDGETFFLRKVPFRRLPIGGYEYETETVRDQVWVHSVLSVSRKLKVYYRLRDPAPEYDRFFTPFLWIADLAKHFINFCSRAQALGKPVVLEDMKHRLHTYIKAKHDRSDIVAAWYAANRTSDFRVAIIANIEHIWKEAHSVLKDPSWQTRHTIWKEIKTFEAYQPNLTATSQLLTSAGITTTRTTVTPYIYRLFEHFDFGPILNASPLTSEVQTSRSEQVSRTSHHVQKLRTKAMRFSPQMDRSDFIARIQPGDVISTHMDKPNITTTTWKLEQSVHHDDHYDWMARVQHVHTHPQTGVLSFDVLWLYHPRDTSCGIMKYPWKKELFLSDNCTCHPKLARVAEDEVIALHEVEWFGNELSTAEYFIRQIYFASQNRWERLCATHFDCSIEEETIVDLSIGETVLGPVSSRSHQDTDRLQPLLIEDVQLDNHGKRWAIVRELCQDLNQVHQQGAAINELYCSDKVIKIKTRNLQRRCFVRVVEKGEAVPMLYNLSGTGDLFFIKRTTENAKYLRILRQGFDPSQKNIAKQLRGLDLFCGGGNFGRGLEEGSGVVHMNWSNDISPKAIHTYMANNDGTCQPYLGSVDDLLHGIIQGGPGTPRPGDVGFISGGSPCPGFSQLTKDKKTIKQQKNRSLSASFASFIDCLRPNLGVLENVKGIVDSKKKDSCVLSQLICALVGLGYQTQLMWLDAWSFGASQSRERVFLCFAAPGCTLPRMPEPSHSHPPWTKMTTLGRMSNGMPFSQRENVKTPFEFVTASTATADLPSIADSKPNFCVGYPDHRLSTGYSALLRKQLSAVPMRPYGLNYKKIAFSRNGEEPILSRSQLQIFRSQRNSEAEKKRENISETSKAWGRVHPHGLFPTVTTKCNPVDARTGTWSHWSQNRPITILEARRAQGFHDDEVILGGPAPSSGKWLGIACHVTLRLCWD